MNVRVSAIILVAAIFMAVWDADQQGIAKDRQRIARARAAASAVATTTAATRPLTVAATAADRAAKIPNTVSTPASISADQCIPLPARLAAGTWQVTDETGRQTRITIHAAPETSTERSFCIVSGEHGQRWCFVRINEEQTAELPKGSSRN